MKPFASLAFRRLLLMLVALAVVAGGTARAQTEPAPFKPEEIEALVAPIALYPDPLLTQVLMASTYPLEVVQAARWVKANSSLKGDAAVKAVGDQPWDVSVKSLVAFPQVLEPMDQKIDWTQKLGDAFLADQKAVLDAVQRLRAKAQASGNLQSTEQQKVVVQQEAQQQVIVIEPANPQVVYVPSYNPTIVYGAWGYPAYPPYYWPPSPVYYPGGWVASGFAWGVGLAAGAALIGNANWRGGDVNINVNKAVNIDRNYNRNNVSGGKWQHDASHRQGVSYRDSASRQKYGKDVGSAAGRQDYRGRDGAGGGVGDRPGDRAGDRPGDRAGDRPGDRGGAANRGGSVGGGKDYGGGRDYGGGGRDYGGGGRDNAFSGVSNASASQRDISRGQASHSTMSANRGGGGYSGGAAARPSGGGAASRPSGGGARGGGGGRGGGGRR